MIYLKMEKYGIRGVCLDWFKSYLTDRQLKVRCKTTSGSDIYSDPFDITFGTAQGSCLGPLIFMLFCNDLRLHLDYLHSIQFADDSTLLKSHSNLRYLTYCIEHDLELVQDWFNANKLTLNIDKTVCMVFSPKHIDTTNLNIVLSNTKLPVVPYCKFLGLWIDSGLNWKEHIRTLASRMHSRIGLLKRSKNLLDIHARKVLYFAQIHSILTYGLLIWGNMVSPTALQKIQQIQDKAVQLIDTRKPLMVVYREHNILNVGSLVKLENYKIWFKFHMQQLPTRLHQMMTEDASLKDMGKMHAYNTRRKHELNLPKASGHYKNSFYVKGLREFSMLPVHIKDSNTVSQFVRQCKKELQK